MKIVIPDKMFGDCDAVIQEAYGSDCSMPGKDAMEKLRAYLKQKA
jgi:hypothetical protein